MNSYERVCASIAHRQPDRPPLELMATDGVLESLRRHLRLENEEQVLRRLGVDFRRLDASIDKKQPMPTLAGGQVGSAGNLQVSPYGVVLYGHPNSPQGHRIHGPFYASEDLDGFDWPTRHDVPDSATLRAEMRRHNEAGFCTLTGCDNPFKIAYFMRRFEDFMVDCLLRPDFALELLQRIASVEFARAEAGVRAGARCAMIFGDFAHQQQLMTSPEVFRRVLRPVLAEFVRRLEAIDPRVLVFLHSDGNLMSVLPDLIECGFAAVHPIQPECMDVEAVKRRYGHAVTLFGGMSVQSELPFTEPATVRRLVRRRIETLGQAGGFILAPTNTIIEDVPLENVTAMYEEARRGEL